jgi:hypothetical protein
MRLYYSACVLSLTTAFSLWSNAALNNDQCDIGADHEPESIPLQRDTECAG